MTLPSLRLVVIAGCVLGLGSQLIRPGRTNPPTDPARTLKTRVQLPEEVGRLLDRACRDCHSHETKWPWYSNVAPVSWLLVNHVNHGRSHLNLSDWASYSASEADKRITEMCEQVREGEMPMTSYLWLHEEARLAKDDIDAICKWSSESRKQGR